MQSLSVRGRCIFNAFVIVPKNSSVHSFNDLQGKIFAFTDELSLAGYFYPVFRSNGNVHFWSKTFITGSHDDAIDLVNQGIVDGASVSGYVFDMLRKQEPERTKNVRIIETSIDFGNPPIVLRAGVPEELENALRRTILELNSKTIGAKILSSDEIKMFVSGNDSLYATTYKMVPENIIP